LFDVCEEWVDQTSTYFNVKGCNLPLQGGGDALSGAPHILVGSGTIVAVHGAPSGVWHL